MVLNWYNTVQIGWYTDACICYVEAPDVSINYLLCIYVDSKHRDYEFP